MDHLRLLRPHQWVKNLFILLPALVAGNTVAHLPWANLLFVLLAFCAASSSVYVANDIFDADRDRAHPLKKSRPIAAGSVSVPEGWALAAGLALTSIGLASFASRATIGFVAAYLVLNLAYSVWTKHIPILDCGSIAMGFCLRFLAGGAGLGIPISPALLCVCFFAAFSMALLKRRIELSLLAAGAAPRRLSLQGMNLEVLDLLVGLFSACAVTIYAQWAIAHSKPLMIFTLPFLVIAISRVVWLAYLNKQGEDFAHTLMTDAFCLVFACLFVGAVWLTMQS